MGCWRTGYHQEQNQHQGMSSAHRCSDGCCDQQEHDTEDTHHSGGVQTGIYIRKTKISQNTDHRETGSDHYGKNGDDMRNRLHLIHHQNMRLSEIYLAKVITVM